MKRKLISRYSENRILEKAFCIIAILILILTIIYCFGLDTDRLKQMEAQAAINNELEIVADVEFGKMESYILTDSKTGRQYIIVYIPSRGTLAITERVGLEEDE